MKCHRCSSPGCYREGKKCKELQELKELCEFERRLLEVSSDIEREFYCKLTRLEELLEFANRMGFKKVGIAFCIGLFEEVKFVAEVFERRGFEVFSVACKVGAIDKSELNLKKMQPCKLEAACNPVGQAEVLNEVGTEMNVIVGLCVGHDMLFQMYSRAPVTTLIVKDRVLAHNPAGAIYSGYYRKKLLGR
ncbi:DUF1847 domain-containing protein [Phorcysia thermohydrogeniphila]|uniref:Putative metal-binding protein n=1 Tax=Phorcysia thermohydrogeniphila TaxID=936138 RepID=A0A4R1G771_9BACT|nr:DUF1847 domain-containing protein [Phorcysia thermohydrogeniphila]TCK03358.1 putative metal-binding protein [Phorcysia thermohydrogeniphila]